MDNNGNHIDMDALMGRIQKLLALADPNANDSAAQIEAAMAKVQELLQKYDMTLEQVKGFQAQEADLNITEQRVYGNTEQVTRKRILTKGKYTGWFVDLSTVVAATTNTTAFVGPISSVFIGFKRDVEIASFLFSSVFNRLVDAAVLATAQYTKDYSRKYHKNAMLVWDENHPWNWRAAWLEGAVDSIVVRLYTKLLENQTEQSNEHSQALIVLDNAVKDYIKATRPNTGKIGDQELFTSEAALEAYKRGREVGENLPLQQGLKAPSEQTR